MGDYYRPGRQAGREGRGGREGREGHEGRDSYESSHRERDNFDRHYSPRRSWEDTNAADRVHHDPYYSPDNEYSSSSRNAREQEQDLHFRGTANSGRFQPPQHSFTFRSTGVAVPSFQPRFQPVYRSAAQQAKGTYSSRGRGRGRGHDRFARGGRRAFSRKPAHTRELLNTSHREATPEQLSGMNDDAQPRFKEADGTSDDSNTDHIALQDSDSEYGGVFSKRRKTHEAAHAVPKWSNPDPYTALPPPETLGAPKKDIVGVIRKAKVENPSKQDMNMAVKHNADFISLDMDDDWVNTQSDDGSADVAPATEPVSPIRDVDHDVDRRDGVMASAKYLSPLPVYAPVKHEYLASLPPLSSLPAEHTRPNRGLKRKQPDSYGLQNLLREWKPIEGSDPSPWHETDRSETSNIGLRLHKEICDFYEFARALDHEEEVRLSVIGRLHKVIYNCPQVNGRDVELHSFGSFAAGLYLPTADMDLVALSSTYIRHGTPTFCQSRKKLSILAQHLEYSGVAMKGSVATIANARVPIIKFTDRLSGVKVDVSFENPSGIHANKTFQKWKAQYPAMPPIVMLIKQLLAMRGLNEVHTGGIGGFSVICLVVSMMQHMPELQSKAMHNQTHYGDLLLNFLNLYGNKFDIHGTGIQMDPAAYYDKKKNPLVKANPDRLTIVDPNNANNDISGGSRNIQAILDVFQSAHAAIQQRISDIRQSRFDHRSMLACVWGGNYETFARQRTDLNLAYLELAEPPPAPLSPPDLPLPAARTMPPAKQRSSRIPQEPHEGSENGDSRPVSPENGSKEERLNHDRAMRAWQFRQDYPHIRDVPELLTNGQMQKLLMKSRQKSGHVRGKKRRGMASSRGSDR